MMAADCHAGQYWDGLIQKCMDCQTECKRPHIMPRCTTYCKSAKCKAQSGHYYDGLLRICVKCADVCGRHPAECSLHCQSQYWDGQIQKCMDCQTTCRRPHIMSRCTTYCKSAKCKAQSGHYYDVLLKSCVKCANVCGRHPAECSLHCQTLPSAVATERLPFDDTSRVTYSRAQAGFEDPLIVLYPVLALSMVLLFTSLSLALVIFLRRAREESSDPGLKEANRNQECRVQCGQEVGKPVQGFKGVETIPNSPNFHGPVDDSSPTETCICVHCFPDLKALSQCNDRSLKTPFSFYPYPVLHRGQMQKGGPNPNEATFVTSGTKAQEEAAVG